MCSFHSLQQSWHTECRTYCRGSQGSFYVFTKGMKEGIKYFKSVSCTIEKKRTTTSGHLQSLKERPYLTNSSRAPCKLTEDSRHFMKLH